MHKIIHKVPTLHEISVQASAHNNAKKLFPVKTSDVIVSNREQKYRLASFGNNPLTTRQTPTIRLTSNMPSTAHTSHHRIAPIVHCPSPSPNPHVSKEHPLHSTSSLLFHLHIPPYLVPLPPISSATTSFPTSLCAMGVVKDVMAAGYRPAEILALLRYKRKADAARAIMTDSLDPDWEYAYSALCNVSRSFALVIMELRPQLRHPICVFYLVLRALDTVEDDTSADPQIRRDLCTAFHTFLHTPAGEQPWSSDAFGKGAENDLLIHFPTVLKCYHSLEPRYRNVIKEITARMGAGMADHIDDVSCDSIPDYDQYCHYVAGLVGLGLSDIFAISECEEPRFSDRTHLSNSMGLFLQKTNIIRDYLEDINDGRTFWPREIWVQYGNHLADFKDPANRKFALAVLNHMVTDALRHVPDCIEYMSHVRTQDVFNFVAIPQVMAIATLAECYNNGKVFEGVVKIRRSRTAQLVLSTKNMDALYKVFFDYAVSMLKAVEMHDPNADKTRQILNQVIDICLPHVPASPNLIIPNVISIILFCGLSSYVLKRRQDHFDGAVFTWRSAGGIMEPSDMAAIAALFLVCIYMFGFFLLPYMSKLQQEEVRRLSTAAREPRLERPRVVTLED